MTECCEAAFVGAVEAFAGVRGWEGAIKSAGLGGQQARVAGMIFRGLQDKEIARELGLSVSTVRTHLRRMFVRLGVSDRVGLVMHVVEHRCAECRRRGCPHL